MSGFENPDAEARCAFLEAVRTIAVVGLSPRPARPSHRVAAAMQRFGFRILPVRPGVESVLGEKAYPSLAALPETPDLVDVFRAAEHIDAVVDECIALGLRAIWIQEGIVNVPAATRARDAGMFVVMDRCVWRDYVGQCR